MGWLWGSKNGHDDPMSTLDDDLKQFLKEQQPRPYVSDAPSNTPTAAKEPPAAEVHRVGVAQDIAPTSDSSVPQESLFQDGRYKDLWKTYVPQASIDTVTATPFERVIEARKDRRHAIHRAALENCAFEEELKNQCFSTGSLANRIRATMTMCHAETKTFNRCYGLQAKFLLALGYYTGATRTEDEEEKIQVHADKLYHRMMDYEAEVENAKRTNRKVPPLSSVFDSEKPAPTVNELKVPEEVVKGLKKPLGGYEPHERELVIRSAMSEARLPLVWKQELDQYNQKLHQERTERQKWLTNVFGETIGKFFIPDMPTVSDKSQRPGSTVASETPRSSKPG